MHGQTYTTRCYGLNAVPLEFMCWIPNSLNVTIFEDRVFKEATEVKLNSKHYISSLVRVSYLPVSKFQYENIHTCMHACKESPFSRVWLFVTSWAVACQSPLPIWVFRQAYWNGLPCPPPGRLPYLGIGPTSPASSASQADSLPLRNPLGRY